MFTKAQAQLIISTHDIGIMMRDEEERELLKEQNAELYFAYEAIIAYASE